MWRRDAFDKLFLSLAVIAVFSYISPFFSVEDYGLQAFRLLFRKVLKIFLQ